LKPAVCYRRIANQCAGWTSGNEICGGAVVETVIGPQPVRQIDLRLGAGEGEEAASGNHSGDETSASNLNVKCDFHRCSSKKMAEETANRANNIGYGGCNLTDNTCGRTRGM